MGNTNKKEKIKKIIFSWWFWVIVALVSYFIAVSIPIQWNESGFNFDRWEGINLYGTLFAYLWKISWIIAIVLIIVSIIKSIQKSKIGDYWKISFTILGIVGIIAYVIYSFAGLGIFDNSSSEYDDRIGETDKAKIKQIKIHLDMLEEDGYEVLYFYYSLEGTDMEGGSIEMKSLGSRNEQVWGGLFALSSVYPNSLRYTIIILEPTQECWYDISGELYDAYTGKGELTLNGEVIDVTTAFQLINYQIDELAFCE